MDLDTLLTHYFGSADIESVAGDRLAAGLDQLRVDFAVERSPDRRFALWALLATIGDAPAPHDAFDDPAMQAAARALLDAARDTERRPDRDDPGA